MEEHLNGKNPQKVINAKIIAKVINILAIVFCFSSLWILYNEYLMWALILFPFFCLITLRVYYGYIFINGKKNSPYPTLDIAFTFPCLILFLKGLDYNIIAYENVWIPSLMLSLIMLGLLLITIRKIILIEGSKYLLLFIAWGLLFQYGFGVIINLNCYYDKSSVEIFNAKVQNKSISANYYTVYNLKLEHLDRYSEIDEVVVSKTLYNKVNKGSQISLYIYDGLFCVPWLTAGI